MTFTKRTALSALVFILLSALFPHWVYVSGFFTAIWASLLLSLLNATIRPFLQLISLPLTLFTFGLFSYVVNAATLLMTSRLMGDRFHIASLGVALMVSLILTFVQNFFAQQYSQGYH